MAYTTIDNPELYFQVKAYAGTGSEQSITLDGSENMQPDFVWFKNRTITANHALFDSIRGATKVLNSNATTAEATEAQMLKSFNTDGFTVGTDSTVNDADSGNVNIVSWNWKAGSGTATNSNGTVNTTVNANTTAGFSIVSWTGNGDAEYFGHGLGANADWVLIKNRGDASTSGWLVNHNKVASTKTLFLNTTAAEATSSIYLNTAPDSTRFRLDTDNTDAFIAYCWTAIKGFSKFGSYTGNGNNDGPFVYTGFKPAWVMTKRTNSTEDWFVFDNKRSASGGFNVLGERLKPNTNSTGYTQAYLDFVSNGFKWRVSGTGQNGSSDSYIYMAFAESPFVNSNDVPTNAR